MKNIHLIATDKPSRLFKDDNQVLNLHTHSVLKGVFTNGIGSNQHIYITCGEEIKDCWVLNTHTNEVYFSKGFYGIQPITKKIILTTDQDLIKDGVQAIDGEFLEWFVKNPSCEEVEVGYGWIRLTETDNGGYWVSIPDKQFEMQQEEPKDVVLGYKTSLDAQMLDKIEPKQERMYSEEEVLDILFTMSVDNPNDITKWFEQFKK